MGTVLQSGTFPCLSFMAFVDEANQNGRKRERERIGRKGVERTFSSSPPFAGRRQEGKET